MIPTRLADYRAMIPWMDEVTTWSPLRKWALSEVYRVKRITGESRIIKWGGQEMAGESEIYLNFVHPLQIKAPKIFEHFQFEDSGVIVMEDAGTKDLEQQPEPAYFLEAARELARLRSKATANLERIAPREIIAKHMVTSNDFLRFLDDLLNSPRLGDNTVLLNVKTVFSEHLEQLYQTVPISLVHHDYHAKNLMMQDNGVMPIDWSNAYLSPHLGDLYCLMTEAQASTNLTREDILSAFLEGTDLTIDHLHWQMRIGGLCWLIKTLRWLVYDGIDIIPGSDAWIPDLLNDVDHLYQEIG